MAHDCSSPLGIFSFLEFLKSDSGWSEWLNKTLLQQIPTHPPPNFSGLTWFLQRGQKTLSIAESDIGILNTVESVCVIFYLETGEITMLNNYCINITINTLFEGSEMRLKVGFSCTETGLLPDAVSM